MGIFYHAPPPTQAAARVPIPGQGDQPPRSSVVTEMQIVGGWPHAYETALYQGNFSRIKIAPLTLIYGDQPPPRRPQAARQDQNPDWAVQSAPKAAWNVPVTAEQVPSAPWPLAIWRAWENEVIPARRRDAFAPLTLVYGDQPPPMVLAASWQIQRHYQGPEWSAPSTAPTAAWNIPVIVSGDAPPPRLSTAQWQAIISWFDGKELAWRITTLSPLPIPGAPAAVAETFSGGWEDYRQHPYLRSPYRRKKAEDKEKIAVVIESLAQQPLIENVDDERELVKALEFALRLRLRAENLIYRDIFLSQLKDSYLKTHKIKASITALEEKKKLHRKILLISSF